MNVLLSMKSMVIGVALNELLAKENPIDNFFIDNETCGGKTMLPDVIVADRERIRQKCLSRWTGAKVILLDTGLNQDELIDTLFVYRLAGVISTD